MVYGVWGVRFVSWFFYVPVFSSQHAGKKIPCWVVRCISSNVQCLVLIRYFCAASLPLILVYFIVFCLSKKHLWAVGQKYLGTQQAPLLDPGKKEKRPVPRTTSSPLVFWELSWRLLLGLLPALSLLHQP